VGLWDRYVGLALAPRTIVACTRHARERLLASDACAYKSRIFQWSRATPEEIGGRHEKPDGLYVDRTIATAGIHMAWRLGARRILLLGVDGYKLRGPEGERYYWTGAPKTYKDGRTGKMFPDTRPEKQRDGLWVQDRHEKWVENMRRLRRAFDARKVFACKWPGEGVYNLSARSMVDAWPKVAMEEALKEVGC
jgi:hypothetical protein